MFGNTQKQMRITENPLAALDDDIITESEDNHKSQETWAREKNTHTERLK